MSGKQIDERTSFSFSVFAIWISFFCSLMALNSVLSYKIYITLAGVP